MIAEDFFVMKTERLYDKRRQERAECEKQQRLKGASHGPSSSDTSFTYNPATLSAPNPQKINKKNELMVQPTSFGSF